MIKGISAVLLAAFAVAAVILGIFYFIGVLAWIATFFLFGVFIIAIIFFAIIFIIAVVTFFAMFYYMAEKKPTIQKTGNYSLKDEKGKNE